MSHLIHFIVLLWHEYNNYHQALQASLVAQMVKNLPAMQEIQVQYLDWEEPLEKGLSTHTSILA